MAYNVHGNTFGATSKAQKAGKNVWHEVKGAYPVGGTIDLASYSVGDVIPAGSMVALNQSNHTAEIVKASDASKLASVNGLLYNDIYVDAAAKSATGAATATVVFAGEVYVDRLAEGIPTGVSLPLIVQIKEA